MLDVSFKRTVALPLTEGQQDVYSEIVATLDSGDSRVFLLHGVTGSGKTEVYLQAIEHCLKLESPSDRTCPRDIADTADGRAVQGPFRR